MSVSEDRDAEAREHATRAGIDEDLDDPKEAPSVAKWGMAGLLLVYAGLGTYAVASSLGGGPGSILARSGGSEHPEGVSRSVAAALTQPAVRGGSSSTDSVAASATPSARAVTSAPRAYAPKSAGQAATPPPVVMGLTAVSAVAIGPGGTSDGDHPNLAPYAIDPHSGMSWVTHWYETAHFGNLQQGTGLLLDMGKQVTIKQLELALGGSPGVWGADVEIRIGQTPNLAETAPAATATDVGGRVSQDLSSAVTGRYVEIWFTKLPLDSWGTYQEHVYGIAVRGYVPAAHGPSAPSGGTSTKTTSHVVRLGGGDSPGFRGRAANPHRPGTGHADRHHVPGGGLGGGGLGASHPGGGLGGLGGHGGLPGGHGGFGGLGQ